MQHRSLLNPRDKPGQRAFVPERLHLGNVHINGWSLVMFTSVARNYQSPIVKFI